MATGSIEMTNPPRIDLRALRAAARALAVLGLGAALSGCYTASDYVNRDTPVAYPIDYRDRHPIAIKETDHAVQIFVGTRRGELLASQRADIVGFARSWQREATGGIVIELPSGTPNARAAAETLPQIREILAAANVPPSAIEARPYQPKDPVRLATVRLIYPRMQAHAGPCGLWPKDLGPSGDRQHFENREYWNFGCAHQRALAAMVDNPADLVQPRSEDPIYTARRTTVLDKHRQGQTSVTIDPNANKGKISDVGQ
jgi:pilus assembly protein CpaD